MKKIAMLVWNDFRNDARVLKEAQTLQAAGYKVRVYALQTTPPTAPREILDDGIEVVRVVRSPFAGVRRRIGLNRPAPAGAAQSAGAGAAGATPHAVKRRTPRWRLMLRLASRVISHLSWLTKVVASRPAVVHSHDVNTLPTSWLAARLSGARLVYDAHEISTDREGYQSVRKAVGWVEKRLMPRADATITTTEARARFFARAYRIALPLVLQNRPRRQAVPRLGRDLRAELRLAHDWPIIIYQGGLQSGRGLERLVTVAASLPASYLVLVGGGRLEGDLKQRVADLDAGNRIHFVPKVDLKELLAYTRGADIGVQPIENTCLNHYTTDSNKLFEYLMCGLPVVASDMPEIRKVVEAGECGLLVPPGSSADLAAALSRLIEDGELRRRLAANAQEAARTYNWEAQEQLLVDLYARVLAPRTRP
jgi:glycosyltransferase involved in cell wall biosynthesis